MKKDNCCFLTAQEKEEIQNIEKHLSVITAKGSPVRYQKGHVIFYEGHSPAGFYILKKGDVQLNRTNMEGTKVILPQEADKIFGLFHLLTNTAYCATAQAKTDAEVLFIPKSVVLDFLQHHW